MDNELINKHKNNPSWSEVVRLYSGLFDEQNEREEFILDIAETDVLLAAECKTGSFMEEFNLSNKISKHATNIATNFENSLETGNAILALLEINDTESVFNIFKTTYRRKPNFVHKQAIELIIQKLNLFILENVGSILLSQKNKMFVGWFLFSLNKHDHIYFMQNEIFNELLSYCITERYIEPLDYLYNIFGSSIFNSININTIIEKNLKKGTRKSIRLASFLISRFDLESKFKSNDLVDSILGGKAQATKSKRKLASKIINANNLDTSKYQFYKEPKKKLSSKTIKNLIIPHKEAPNGVKLNNWYECIITNIIKNRVFVKIKNEKRTASIYIGELSESFIKDIYVFEYNNEKIYDGQKLVARVISIDEKYGINLSLKQV